MVQEIFSKEHTEQWGNNHVRVTIGDSIDLISLKKNVVEDFKGNVETIKSSRQKLYTGELIKIRHCPVCGHTSEDSEEAITVYGARYVTCMSCSHRFIIETPSKKALELFYKTDTHYQKTYADKRTTDTRLNQVAMPKLIWAIKQYESVYNRKPKRILDVGAGSGHFVQVCKQSGYEAFGIELSESGRNFCLENFGFKLENKNFLEQHDYNDFDIVTFWGVIEHTPHPIKMLQSAKTALGKEGMVIVQTPHWNSLSTAIQRRFSDSVVRHLDPLGHINIFTDLSLTTAFQKSGFDIKAAWYLGMDAYELVMQLAHVLNDAKVIEKLNDTIPAIQETLNTAKISDGIIFAGTHT